jgi:hypothetical protein
MMSWARYGSKAIELYGQMQGAPGTPTAVTTHIAAI